MRKYITASILMLLPALTMAHSGEDPIEEIEKSHSRLLSAQNEFDHLENPHERFQNLEEQVGYLQRRVLMLRNTMAADYPHVKENMTKYKLDYIEVLDESLKDFNLTLKQMKITLPD